MQPPAPDLGQPVELRVLTGPNLYFPRPAVKLTLDAAGVLGAEPAAVVAWQRALRVRNPTVGLPHSPTRALAAAELAAAVVRRAAGTLRTRVAAVARPGDDDTVVVAFPFRHRGTAELFGMAAPGRSRRSPGMASTRCWRSVRCRPRWPGTIPAKPCVRCARPSRWSR